MPIGSHSRADAKPVSQRGANTGPSDKTANGGDRKHNNNNCDTGDGRIAHDERSGGSRSEHQCSWIGVLKGSRVPERKRLEASRIQVLACRMLVRLRELPRNEKQIAMPAHLINAAMNGQVSNRAAPPTLPAITSDCAIPHSLVEFFRYPAGFRNFIPKHLSPAIVG